MTNETDIHEPAAESDDDEIRALVTRLSRPHRTGGRVIERAALIAEGSDFDAIIAWIEAHGGEPEAPPASRGGGGGLHSSRSAPDRAPAPLRFILPAAALR